jgi:hypothetical protein
VRSVYAPEEERKGKENSPGIKRARLFCLHSLVRAAQSATSFSERETRTWPGLASSSGGFPSGAHFQGGACVPLVGRGYFLPHFRHGKRKGDACPFFALLGRSRKAGASFERLRRARTLAGVCGCCLLLSGTCAVTRGILRPATVEGRR